MHTIYKYRLDDFQGLPFSLDIEMPIGAKILCVQIQNNVPCIWVLADSTLQLEKRTFACFGTGQDIGNISNLEYIGTCQRGWLVLHLFERRWGISILI